MSNPAAKTTDDAPIQLTRKDFDPGIDVRWCPGCGDYAILAAVQRTLPELPYKREDYAFISGIGCSSRFPYYMNTYGFHTIHGRAAAIATGLKATRPELSVWVITGDGDGLSIGGNHTIHALRRNPDINVLLFNNKIYGLTKGQYSPTSEQGKKTKSTPFGSLDQPFNPLSLGVGAEGSWLARAVDRDAKHLSRMLKEAAEHRGTSFLEIYQNCNIFNDGAWSYMTDRDEKVDNVLYLEHGEPMLFGKDNEKCIVMSDKGIPTVAMVADTDEKDILVHDAHSEDPGYAFMLTRMGPNLGTPTPLGVLRSLDRPTYEDMLHAQVNEAKEKRGEGKIQALLKSGETWQVNEDGSISR